MQRSPYAILQAGNLYAYCMNNPVMWNDPSGLNTQPALTGIIRILVSDYVKKHVENYNSSPRVAQAYDMAAAQWLQIAEVTNQLAENALDVAQIGLDVAGLAPGIGEPADATNALIYAARGDNINAALSAASTIPLAGMSATIGKWGNRGLDAAMAAKSLDNVLEGKQFTNKTSTGVSNFTSSSRGMDAARADFNSLNPTNVRTASNGTVIGDLLDGRVVNIHPGSSVGGAPTLEVFNRNTMERTKIRY
jgi:hypothetical protein